MKAWTFDSWLVVTIVGVLSVGAAPVVAHHSFAMYDQTVTKTVTGKLTRFVVGGNGVSGQAFIDNAAFRQYVFATFNARVLDMESAAVAMVAYANGVPFIAFRSLSDLAGGGEGANEIRTFFRLASDNSAAVVQRFLTLWTPPR